MAGAIAGAPAAFLVTPMDMIKTRLQVSNLYSSSQMGLFKSKGLASYSKAETTFTFHFPILTLSSAFLSINNREMKSESGFSFAMASKPFHFTTHRHHHPSNLHPTSSLKNFLSFMKGSSNPTRLTYNCAYLRSTKES